MKEYWMNSIFVLIFVLSLMSTTVAKLEIHDQDGTHDSANNMQSTKVVIIRDDDVYKVDPGLEWLSKFIIDNDLKITYAVIPALISNDTYTIGYLNLLIKWSNIELATHGYEHVAFAGLPYDVQYSLIDEATNRMEQYFKIRPRTFIPPFESADQNTTKACRDLGYHSISGYPTENSSLINFERNFSWEKNYSNPNLPDYMVPHSSFVDFKSNFDKFYNSSAEIYVIVMHHSTWCNESGELNKTLTKEFDNTIDYMKSKNVEFMTIEQAYEWHINKK